MKTSRVVAFAAACFVAGVLISSGLAQSRTPRYEPNMLQGSRDEVGARFLEGALVLAEEGSWERIAVGRAWYLGGDKVKGQQIFDGVTASRKVEGSDWFRIARVYAEAGEWPKARDAFEKALARDTDDDTGAVEAGSYANVYGDRAGAEALFRVALPKKPKEFWHWVNVGGSYLGVEPD